MVLYFPCTTHKPGTGDLHLGTNINLASCMLRYVGVSSDSSNSLDARSEALCRIEAAHGRLQHCVRSSYHEEVGSASCNDRFTQNHGTEHDYDRCVRIEFNSISTV